MGQLERYKKVWPLALSSLSFRRSLLWPSTSFGSHSRIQRPVKSLSVMRSQKATIKVSIIASRRRKTQRHFYVFLRLSVVNHPLNGVAILFREIFWAAVAVVKFQVAKDFAKTSSSSSSFVDLDSMGQPTWRCVWVTIILWPWWQPQKIREQKWPAIKAEAKQHDLIETATDEYQS